MTIPYNIKPVGNRIYKVGPFCLKLYGRHKRLLEIPPDVRLKRELAGARLLSSRYLTVTAPIVWSSKGLWSVRTWYNGLHPSSTVRPDGRDLNAFAAWLREHRGRANEFPFEENKNLSVITHLSMLGISENRPLARSILDGNDILHADLVPENILLGGTKPIVLDPEGISTGSLTWDAAQLLYRIFGVHEGEAAFSEFIELLGFSHSEIDIINQLIVLFRKVYS